MKIALALIVTAFALSACVTTVINQPQPYVPVQHCRWVNVPVYGYADLYRSHGYTHRVQQVAFVDRQWRCN